MHTNLNASARVVEHQTLIDTINILGKYAKFSVSDYCIKPINSRQLLSRLFIYKACLCHCACVQ